MSHRWLLSGFLVLALAERIYERRYSHQAERGERKLEWVMTALHTLYGLIYLGAAVECFAWTRPVCWPVTGVGLVLYGASLWLRLKAIRTLGRFWSLHLEIRPDHQLITTGIYAHVRHPAYTAIMMEVVAIPLVTNAWVTLVLALGAYIPVLLVRWYHEEIEMIRKFRDPYVRYRQRVPAFLPIRWPGRSR